MARGLLRLLTVADEGSSPPMRLLTIPPVQRVVLDTTFRESGHEEELRHKLVSYLQRTNRHSKLNDKSKLSDLIQAASGEID